MQTPLVIFGAEQEAEDPPFEPLHVQFQGPVPAIPIVVPEEQRFAVGIETTAISLADPQAPLTISLAEQVESVPPFNPAHVQFIVGTDEVGNNGNDGIGIPAEQNVYIPNEVEPAVKVLLAVPQTPLTEADETIEKILLR